MLELSPEFRNYGPPPLMFGGIEITPPYGFNLTKQMSKVLKDVTDSIQLAYEINTRIITPSNNVILTTVSPLASSITEKYRDYSLINEQLARTLLQNLNIQKKDTGLFTHNKGFYVVHKLKEKLDTEATEFLLTAIKTTILTLTYNKFRVTSAVSDNLLRVEAEITKLHEKYII